MGSPRGAPLSLSPRTPSAGHRGSGGTHPPSLLGQASPAQMATTLKLQQSAQKLQAAEAELRSLRSSSPRSDGRGRTPPRARSPTPSPGQQRARERKRAAARLEVDLLLHGMERDQSLMTVLEEAINLAEALLEKRTVFPDSEGARRELVLKWYKMTLAYSRTAANAHAAMFGALVILADPSSELCTVDYVADHIEAYESEHPDQAGGWQAWARRYTHTVVPSLEMMGEDARVNQLRRVRF